jgi:CRISPR-associated protein Csx14
MSELRLPFDPCNPGQFFACCGLFELAAAQAASPVARFVCNEDRPRHAEFVVSGSDLQGLEATLKGLRELTCEVLEGTEDSIRPVRLRIDGRELELDWWLDEFRLAPTNLKCWAGQVTTRKLFEELPGLIDPDAAAERLMRSGRMTKSKFGGDPRSAWNALDFGYSPNVHNQDAATYPAVEVLGAIGLQGFRPRAERRNRVAYSLWTVDLPLPVARMAARAPWDGLPRFDYHFEIAKRGQSYKYFTFGQFDERKAYYQ